METVLVSGGAGFIGSHTCEKLIQLGYRVLCIDNLNDYYDPRFKQQNLAKLKKSKSFSFYKADICNRSEMGKLFSKNRIDRIIHLAARAGVRPSIEDPGLYAKVNISGTINLLEEARKNSIKYFVFGSSSSVYGNCREVPFSEDMQLDRPISPYAATKKAGELICYAYHHLYNINISCLRFFTVYGPRGRPDMAPYKFLSRIAEGIPIDMYGDGSTSRDYTYVADIVDGIIASMERLDGYQIFNLGNSNPITLSEFIAVIESVTGKQAVIKREKMQPGDVDTTYSDITKAARMLGYRPKVQFREGISMMYDWLKNHDKR
ncbi:GDP-mannose 4,6-dehydratase [Candidatus Woesearchaeota archaeon]|nr:GDP-mannose 4,6-dehydratase [Candidatus Woesearchaeota archaeon]